MREYNGSSGSEVATDKTSGTVRFKKADNASVDISDPIPKPGSGLTERSMEKWVRARIDSVGPSGSITDLVFYTSGTLGTGATVYIRTTAPSTYATPAIPANDSGGTDASTLSSGSPKAMGSGPFTSTNTDIGNFAVLWASLADTVAAPGTLSGQTAFFGYKET
jgi:hypothetical protein